MHERDLIASQRAAADPHSAVLLLLDTELQDQHWEASVPISKTIIVRCLEDGERRDMVATTLHAVQVGTWQVLSASKGLTR